MRILGIDYGTKRIGLALSDKTAKFAFPLRVLELKQNPLPNLLTEIKKICEEKEVKKIVLGRPEGYKGNPGRILQKIAQFKKELEKITCLEVVYENEVLTTRQAKRPFDVKSRGKISNYRSSTPIVKKVDAASAAIILQSYLDRAQCG